MERLRRFLMDQEGVSAIEYALIASLIAMAIIGSVIVLGNSVTTTYQNIQTEINNAS